MQRMLFILVQKMGKVFKKCLIKFLNIFIIKLKKCIQREKKMIKNNNQENLKNKELVWTQIIISLIIKENVAEFI